MDEKSVDPHQLDDQNPYLQCFLLVKSGLKGH